MSAFAGRPAEASVLDLLVRALPHLRGGLRPESAEFTAQLLYEHLSLDAAAVVSTERILAFVGAGSDHHVVGMPNLTKLTHAALSDHAATIVRTREDVGCPVPDCPLSAAVVAPLWVGNRVVGALKLYHAWGTSLGDNDEKIASGLARVFSVYLEVAELDARAALVQEAELGALRAQISPHFLFNTLTTIAALTRIDPARAHDLIVDFADYFRQTLARHGELVTLREELDHVERYLRFELARFGERLRVRYETDDALLGALVPVLSIQPLVENAVAHGIAPAGRAGTVTIRARRAQGGTLVEVCDDGAGIAGARLPHVLEAGVGGGLGIGMSNVNRRLEALFGARSGLQVESREGQGTTVRFWVPAQRTPR